MRSNRPRSRPSPMMKSPTIAILWYGECERRENVFYALLGLQAPDRDEREGE